MDQNEIDPVRLIPWSLARSIFGASKVLSDLSGGNCVLEPKLMDRNKISLSKNGGLIFTDANLMKMSEKGFAYPVLSSIVSYPVLAFKTFRVLKKIEALYRQESPNIDQVKILMRSGLEASVTYANHHHQSRMLMEEEKGMIIFSVEEFGVIGWVRRNKMGIWETGSENFNQDASVYMNFKNLNLALDGTLGKLNHMVEPAIGNIFIRGRLPLLEKFGFVSRTALREIPLPR